MTVVGVLMKIKISSLGCRLNQSEVDSVATVLIDRGHSIVKNYDADVYIVNACSVTLRSERKTRQLVYRALGATNENALVILTGCTGDVHFEDGILHISNDHKYLIPDLIDNYITPSDLKKTSSSRFSYVSPVKSPTNRVNLKIQDGCDRYCSYCIIPYMRGEPQSKPMKDVLHNFNELIDAGYSEIILSGVMIGNYNDKGNSLEDLVEELLKIQAYFRIHLTSISPSSVSHKLIDLLSHENMVHHLHLSLQSGSDTVLQRMNRSYTGNDYRTVVNNLRKKDSLFNFTTDIITGFPGETDAEFNDTIQLVTDVMFSHIHTFRFSPRPGTKAADMTNQVEEYIKTERSNIVQDLCLKMKSQFYNQFRGRETIFLSEKFKKGVTTGFNEYYVPIEIVDHLPKNQFYRVRTEYEEGSLSCNASIIEELLIKK